MEDQDFLEQTNFDCIVVGTGLVESLVAAASSRCGKKVLHLDENAFYGGQFSSFTLEQLLELPNTKREILPDESSEGVFFVQPCEPWMKDVTTFEFKDECEQVKESLTEEPIPEDTKETVAEETLVGENTQPQHGDEAETKEDNEPETSEGTGKEECPEPVNKEPLRENLEQILTQSRQYSIDISPRMIFSCGSMIPLLIRSGVARYVEFNCFERTYMYLEDELRQVPCSKGDIFTNKFISLKEKRFLMSFLNKCLAPDEAFESSVSGFEDKPFVDFLLSKRLSPKLISFILYSIALAETDQERGEGVLMTPEGLSRLSVYLSSLGKFGTTPFIYPLYGVGEIPQAFCRLCAVYGGMYVLRRGVRMIFCDESTYTGIECTVGQKLESKNLVVNSSYCKFWEECATKKYVSHLIVVSNNSLVEDQSRVFIVLPPSSFANPSSVHIFQFDSSLQVCPRGKYLTHFVMDSQEGQTAEQNLKPALELLFSTSSTQCDGKPEALWGIYFTQEATESVAPNEDIPKNVYLCPDSCTTVGYSEAISAAEAIWNKMYPDIEFLERVPGENETVWVEQPVENKETKEEGQEGGDKEIKAEDQQKEEEQKEERQEAQEEEEQEKQQEAQEEEDQEKQEVQKEEKVEEEQEKQQNEEGEHKNEDTSG